MVMKYSVITSISNKILPCLLYTSDAADDLLCVDLGGRRIIKKKTLIHNHVFIFSILLYYTSLSIHTLLYHHNISNN